MSSGFVHVSVNIKEDANLEEIERLIGELPAYLDKYLWSRMLTVAKEIAAQARTDAPKKTGFMASQIFATVEQNGIGIICEVDYAKFQEYGTKYILPSMFINGAMADHYEEIRQTIVSVIQDYFATVKA